MLNVRPTAWWLLLTAMLLMFGMATPAAAGNAGGAACDPNAEAELRIRSCSDLIRSATSRATALPRLTSPAATPTPKHRITPAPRRL
jgi:hypothetical protein